MKKAEEKKDYITYRHKVHNKYFCYRIYKKELRHNLDMYLKICELKQEIPKSKITLIREAIQNKIIECLEKSFKNR